jgi:phospho-N-acetylmuramoyl-pentapeptide-transferase
MLNQIVLFFSAAITSFLITYPIVWLLRLFHLNQSIREEAPKTHKAKAGTPTMGGLGFILVFISMALIFIDFEYDLRYFALILLTLGFSLVGLADDLIIIFKQKNLGLTFWQKIFAQTVLAAVFSLFLIYVGHNYTVDGFLKSIGFSNPVLYFLFSVFVIVGTANATNLTDGLNGLLAGTATIAFVAFGLLSQQYWYPDAVVFCFLAAGAVFAFLFYNFPNARVFMGDIGSLGIGAALAGVALVTHKEINLIVIGGIFLIEAASVILQVTSYKLFKKRIFKMTPLHHTFELMGIKEPVIVVGFWVIGVILGIIGIAFLF